MKSPVTCAFALVLVFTTALAAPAQDDKAFAEAKRSFDRNIKSKKMVDRKGGIAQLVSTKDPRALKKLMTAIHVVRKKEAKARKKLGPLLKQGEKIAKELDKKFQGSAPVTAGTVNHLGRKRMDLDAKMRPLYDAWAIEADTKTALFAAIGELVESMEDPARTEQIQVVLTAFEKTKRRKFEDRAVYIEMLSNIRSEPSVSALVSLVMDDLDPNVRTAALNGLARIGSSRGGKAATHALDDDFWHVRAAAASALRTCGDIDAIPGLIARLGKEGGRLKGDIIDALVLMSGVTFHDNVPLWEKWWKENEKGLRGIMADVRSDNPVSRDNGLHRASEAGFLLAANAVLERRGLTVARVMRQETLRTKDPEDELLPAPGGAGAGGVKADEQERVKEVELVGKTIGSRDLEIREKAYETVILPAIQRSRAHAKLMDLITISGQVRCDAARRELSRRVLRPGSGSFRRGPERKDKRAQLIAAITALGKVGGKTETRFINSWLRDSDMPEPDIVDVAITALADIGLTRSVTSLLAALDELENGGDKYKASAELCVKELGRVTNESAGTTYASWREWWTGAKDDFKTANEKETKTGEVVAKNDEENKGTAFYGIKTYSKRIMYVLDVSGSMEMDKTESGVKKIDEAKKQLLESITSLPKGATFNIIFYASSYRIWKKKMVEATPAIKKEARDWIKAVQAEGATNIYDPLAKAFEMAGRGTYDKRYKITLDTIFFMSDGEPNQGRITNPRDILREILAFNDLKRVQIHSVGVGKGHNAGFMRALAEGTGGQYISRK